MEALDTGFGVKGLILDGGKGLVLFTPDGGYDLPGGRLEANESSCEGLQREIFEETGIREVVITDSSVNWSFRKGGDRLIKGTTWLCHFQEGPISLSTEHSGYTWKSVDQLQDLDIYRKYGLDKFDFIQQS